MLATSGCARNKVGMKRRRPWASTSTIVATTILLTAQLWTQTAGVPIFFENEPMLAEGAIPEELDVYSPTPAPSERITLSPAPSKAPQTISDAGVPAIIKQSYDLSYDVVLNVTKTVDINDLLRNVKQVMEDYLFQRLRLLEEDNDIEIRKVTVAVGLLVRRYLESLRRRLQDRQSQDITIEVDGSVQYDLESGGNTTPELAVFLLEEELILALTQDNIRQALQDAQVEGILDVDEATIVDSREPVGNPTSDGQNEGQTNGNDMSSTGDTNKLSQGGKEDKELERPSTLSIVFGFALTGIAFLGLVAYAYIFYRKRQKRLRRKKQMKESIQYRLPAPKVSPVRRSAPNTPQQQPIPQIKMVPHNADESSDGSSYKGLESGSEGDPADSFARELQMAASLDEQAWEDFQRKKEALNRNEVIRATEVGSALGEYDSGVATPKSQAATPVEKSGGTWAKSFPYGDEQEVMEEGIEWTAEDADNWNMYKDSNRPAIKAEEKKDDLGGDQQRPSASASTSAILESIQRDLAMHGTNIDPEPTRDDMTASDVVLEVERLSRYVKRYEKRKERRAKREQERSFRSSDVSSHNNSIPSPTNSEPVPSRSAREASVSPQGFTPRSEPPLSRSIQHETFTPKAYFGGGENLAHANSHGSGYPMSQKENVQRQEQAPKITSYTGSLDRNDNLRAALSPNAPNPELSSVSDYPDEVSEDTFDYTFQEQEQEGSLRSQRLGITPFHAQQEEEPSFNYEAMSPMMQKLAKVETSRPSREDHSTPPNEPVAERRRRTQSDGEPYTKRGGQLSALRGSHAILDARRPGRLSDLRDNTAIIDSSQSDVNVGFLPTPYDEAEVPRSREMEPEPQAPATTPKQKKYNNGPSPSKKFNKLRNLFEERQNEAIFPPDQHWQYGIAK